MRRLFLLLLLCPLLAFAVVNPTADSTKSVLPLYNESTTMDSLLTTNQSVLYKQGTLEEHLVQVDNTVKYILYTVLGFITLTILCVLIALWHYVKSRRKSKKCQIDDKNNIIDKWSEFFNTANDELENFKIQIRNADKLQKQNEGFDKFRIELAKKIEDINDLLLKDNSESMGQNSKNNSPANKKNVDNKAKDNSDDPFRGIFDSVDIIKKHIIQTEENFNKQIRNIENNHTDEINKLTNNHKQKLETAQKESKAYRDMLCFVRESEKEAIQQYASNVLEVIELADTKVREVLNNISESKDPIIKNKAEGFIAQFEHQTQNSQYQAWISELLLLSKTGIFMLDNKASKINGILSGTSEQFDNLKYRLHKDFFSKYCSALLILYQKMKNIEKYVCSNDTGKNGKQDLATIKNIFSEKEYSHLLKLIKKNLGYNIVEVDLFKEYNDTNQDEIEIDSCSNDNYDNNVILDICIIGVNYGSSKNKTKIILNVK